MPRLHRWQRSPPPTTRIAQSKTSLLCFSASTQQPPVHILIVFYILSTVTVPNFVSVFHQLPNECKCKETVRRTPSAPSATIDAAVPVVFPFGNVSSSGRGGYSLRGDVANDSGISDALFSNDQHRPTQHVRLQKEFS